MMSENNPWVIGCVKADNPIWTKIQRLISEPQIESGSGIEFVANVSFLARPEYQQLTPQKVVEALPESYEPRFVFVVDSLTLQSEAHPILVIGFESNSERSVDIHTFRALPSTIQSIENNLSIGNMDFQDFANNTDSEGIFRGFPS